MPPTSLVPGLMISFKANTSNTGASALQVNDLDPVAIKKVDVDISDGDIYEGQVVTVIYDGTYFQLISPSDIGTIVVVADGPTNLTVVGKSQQVTLAGNRTLAISNMKRTIYSD